jgi:hypothetical protein
MEYRGPDSGFALPADGAELPVLGRGNVLGRFVLVPEPGTTVTLEQRVVAIAIADQVGANLADPSVWPGNAIAGPESSHDVTARPARPNEMKGTSNG